MPQPKLKVLTSVPAKVRAVPRRSEPTAGLQPQHTLPPAAAAAADKQPADDSKHSSPPSTTATAPTPQPPPDPTATSVPSAAEDDELDNPLNFPLPLLSHDEIIDHYLTVPAAKADLARHSADPRWLDYCQLANTGRQERNVWTLFSRTCDHFTDKRAVVWLNSAGQVEQEWTFGELKQRIRRVAYWLAEVVEVEKGDRAILCFVPGLENFVGFWACLSLGVVAVPVCPPDPFQPVSDVSAKLESIMANCQPRLILSTSEYTNAIEAAKTYRTASSSPSSASSSDASVPLYKLKFECIDLLPDTDSWKSWSFPTAIHLSHGLSLAFLQYTSGSTGQPKGVMVGHVNILYNAINCTLTTRCQKSFDRYCNTVGVSWLPTFHDMGLIGFHIAPIIFGGCVVYFSPLDFLRDPLLWLRVVSDWGKRGHWVSTGGPPFALELCVKRLKEAPASVVPQLDLARLQSIIVGAEPIRLPPLTSFTESFAPYGFSANTLMPAYGLAENVLHALSKMENTYPPISVYIDMQQLRNGRLVELPEGQHGGKWLVSSGERRSQDPVEYPALPMDGTLLIVKEGGVEAADGEVGEIWLYGKSNTGGYYNQPDETARTFMAKLSRPLSAAGKRLIKKSFVRTGDIGVLWCAQLYVTGRLKEMIILNGVNHYPHDIEDCVRTCHADIKAGSVMAVACMDRDREGLLVMLEVNEKEAAAGGGGGSGKMGKREMAIAQKVFKQANKLPVIMRAPAIRGLAKLGAWWTTGGADRDKKSVEGVKAAMYSESEMDSVEKAIRRAVMYRFGIPIADVILAQPKTVLKTSSGKIRRTATAQALQAGALDPHLLRRTTKRSSTTQPQPAPTTTQPSRPASRPEPVPDAPTASGSRTPLVLSDVRQRIASILAEELKLDTDTILTLSETFTFDEEAGLDEYGLDSLSAMRIAGRLVKEFDLLVPLSPFMFLSEPTLHGMCKVVMSVYQMVPARASAADRGDGGIGRQSSVSRSHPTVGPAHANATSSATTANSSDGAASLPCIMGIGCVVPGPGAPQLAITEVMISDMQLPAGKAKLFRKIGETCMIDRRYSVLPSMDAIYFGRKGLGNDESIHARNAVYKREAPILAAAAANKAIDDWGGDRSHITHVVAVTCTGVIVPGLEFHIMERCGLPKQCQRLSIQFMGCFGALSGLKTARAFAAERSENVVLLVCCELCSLHMQLDARVDNMVGSALFADGASAVIVAQPTSSTSSPLHPRPPLYELHHSTSLIVPNTADMMAWELTNSGMSIGLGREIPTAIYTAIEDFATLLLQSNPHAKHTPYSRMRWCLHPGGPMIIQAICDRLGLVEADVDEVWSVLRRYGNMSSATLLFVLDEMRKQPLSGVWVPALAFGPGLNVEGALLRACDGPLQPHHVTAVATTAQMDVQLQPNEQVATSKEEVVEEAKASSQADTVVKRVSFSSVSNNTGLL